MIGWGLLRVAPISQERYVENVGEFCEGMEVYYPLYERLERKHGMRGCLRVLRPVFPGYVFAKVDSSGDDVRRMVSLPVKAYWVRFGGKIELVGDTIVARIRTLEVTNQLVVEKKYEDPFRNGISVRVHLPVGDILGVVIKKLGGRVVVDAPMGRCVAPRHLLELI